MLPSLRDSKTRSEYPKELPHWLELDYFRRPGALRAGRRALSAAVFVLSLGCVGLFLLSTRDRRAFQAGPVSRVHRLINDDCNACHTRGFETAKRLWHGDSGVHSVADASCLKCHPGPVHHRRQVGETACASCHREHRSENLLAQVDSQSCTSCHADLNLHLDPHQPREGERSFRNVGAFTPRGHPEFALWKPGVRDEGTILFNHEKHLNPRGIPVGEDRRLRVLSCDRCHEPDADRRYMRSIAYDRHCAECHPLKAGVAGTSDDSRLREAAIAFAESPIPHPQRGENAATVRAVLRERYVRFLQDNPAVLGERSAEQPRRVIPGRRERVGEPATTEAWNWVGDQLKQAEHALFRNKAGCLYCHQELPAKDPKAGDLPSFAPGIKARWLPHSIFDHERHRALDCQQCHAGVSQSAETSQILMPRIGVCQQCHKPERSAARADCTECHRYHPAAAEPAWTGSLSIEALLREHGRAVRSKE